MQIDDLMQVMRGEFASAAADVDEALMGWLGDEPAQAAVHAEPIVALLDRLAQTSRMICLDGLATVLEQLRDSAGLLAMVDEDTMGQGLGWLLGWRSALEPCFERPGDADAARQLVEYMQAGPMALPPDACEELAALLLLAPALPAGGEDAAALLPPATEDDVSLEVPADVDHGLLETLLNEAPDQLALLGDSVRALVRGKLSVEQLVEAQRVAHTFKGSGNIIGIRGVARMAHRIEDLLDVALTHGGSLPVAVGQAVDQAVATLDQMVFALRGEEAAPLDARAHMQALLDWINALRDGSWEERTNADPVAQAIAPMGMAVGDTAAAVPRQAVQAPTREADGAAGEAQLRVGVSHLERLVRRAGQTLVQGGRMNEQVRVLEDRLAAIETNNQLLRARLRELETALERQGVSLQERVQEVGGAFDPLEMDRYNELHALSRFVTELVADELELTRAARNDAREAQGMLREHGLALKEQHRELLGARLVPFRHIVARLRRNVSQTAAATGKRARLEVTGELVQLDADVLDRLTEPLLHLLRNAVDHGIEPPEERTLYGKPEEGVVHLTCSRDGQTVRIDCQDDGRGLDLGAIHAKAIGLGLVDAAVEPDPQMLMRTILLPGFSTREHVTEVSGRGVGMDVVAERVRAMKGHVDIHSAPLDGTLFTLKVPATTGAVHALVVRVAGEEVALPTEAVLMALAADQGERVAGRLRHMAHDVPCADLASWLGLARPADAQSVALADGHAVAHAAARPVVLITVRGEVMALEVDAVLDARDLILQDVGPLLRRLPGVGGGALRPDGQVLFVLDVERIGLARGAQIERDVAMQLRRRSQVQRKRALVVDDSLSVRKALGQLLGDAGYEVDVARDGFEALDAIGAAAHDIVLTDLEMPNLNGLDLTRRLRQDAATRSVPVILITSRSSDKHREAAAEAGVSHYLTKPYTDADLLGRVRALVEA